MKPLISSLNRLTSHDTNTPPAGMLRIVWLLLLGSQDPIPDTADTGRHLMRMESEDKRGSEAEETREALTMREMGSIFPGTEEAEAEAEAQQNEKRIGRQWKEGLTSFGISQIVNKDCLPRAQDSFITELDTETKDNGMSDRGGGTWSKGGGGRGERGGKACCTNTAAGGTGTKTHLNAS
jgi:hypothetical protein